MVKRGFLFLCLMEGEEAIEKQRKQKLRPWPILGIESLSDEEGREVKGFNPPTPSSKLALATRRY